MKLIIVAINFFWLSLAAASPSDRIGNGGTYVICNRNPIYSYFYDYYELTRIKKQKVITGLLGKNPFERAKSILHRQNANNAFFISKMDAYIDHMKKNLEISDEPLIYLHDNPGYSVERQCSLYQAAISSRNKHKWLYEISAPAWHYMDKINAATLVLHEVIYRFASERGQVTSTNTKLLVQALLTSDRNSDPNKILDLRKKLDIVTDEEL